MSAVCSSCGSPIRATAPGGQCPRCLLQLAHPASIEDQGTAADLNEPGFLSKTQVRHFGDYELIEEIARGGMGVVYRAHQISLNRLVAVKMILAGQLATPDSVQRFRLEAKAAAKLDHPNIVPIYEVGEDETQHYFTMKLVEGGSLADRMEDFLLAPEAGRLAARSQRERELKITALLMKVTDALAYAHSHGVLHRDLKPNNILLDRQNEPFLTDFGLAKLATGSTGLTLTTSVLGSPSYMAPEQAAGGTRDVTTEADIYGLGAVLYELLTGRPPFVGETVVQTIRKVLEEPPVPPSRVNLSVSPDLETICLKCLEKNPGRRYQSARALLDELERFRRGEPIEARPVPPLEHVWRWCQRKPAIASLSATALLAFVVGLAGVLWQWRRAETSRKETQLSNQKLRKTLDRLEWRAINNLLEQDYAGRAVAHLADRLRREPASWQAASYAISILEQCAFAMPAGLELAFETGLDPAQPIISDDGKRAAIAASDHRVRVHDTDTGTAVFPAFTNASPVIALAFAGNGKFLLTGSSDGRIWIRDATSGGLLQELSAGAGPLRELTTSGDGQLFGVAAGRLARIWKTDEAIEGKPAFAALHHSFQLAHLRLSKDGSRTLAWGAARTDPLTVWETTTGNKLFVSPPRQEVLSAAMDEDGKTLAATISQYEVQAWDVSSARALPRIKSEKSVVDGIELTPDGTGVVLRFSDASERTYSTASGLPLSNWMRHLYTIHSTDLDSAGARLATSSQDHSARIWDLASGSPLSEPIRHSGPVTYAAFSKRSDRILTAANDSGRPSRRVSVWQLRRRREPQRFCPRGGRDLNIVRLSPDGKLAVVPIWTPRRELWIYDVAAGVPVFGPEEILGDSYGVEFTPDLKRLVLATGNGWLYCWSVGDWQRLWGPIKTSIIQPTAISPDGKTFATGGPEGILRLWDTKTGHLLAEMNRGAGIKGLRFSPTGDRIVCGSADGIAVVWDTQKGVAKSTLKGHQAEILSVEFNRAGDRIVTASYDSTVRIWDAATGGQLTAPLQHQGEASHASFSFDGRLVATAARDGTARIWDAKTGRPTVDWMHHRDTVQSVEFHPDGRRLATRDHAGFRIWDIDTGEPVTLHYQDPVTGGVGLDSTSVRELFSRDGRKIFLGCATDAATLWDVPAPPPNAPAWFADFLEAVANQRLGSAGEYLPVPNDKFREFRALARTFQSSGYYESWVRQYLGFE